MDLLDPRLRFVERRLRIASSRNRSGDGLAEGIADRQPIIFYVAFVAGKRSGRNDRVHQIGRVALLGARVGQRREPSLL